MESKDPRICTEEQMDAIKAYALLVGYTNCALGKPRGNSDCWGYWRNCSYRAWFDFESHLEANAFGKAIQEMYPHVVVEYLQFSKTVFINW